MKSIIIDTREQQPLKFSVKDIGIVRLALPVGDYQAVHENDVRDNTIFERKSVSDLWGSFIGKNYDRERRKILKAKELGIKYILAIESTAWRIREGYKFFKNGQLVESKKDGLAMMKQLMTITRKYDVPVWFCNDRNDMAWRIQEYFLAYGRGYAPRKSD